MTSPTRVQLLWFDFYAFYFACVRRSLCLGSLPSLGSWRWSMWARAASIHLVTYTYILYCYCPTQLCSATSYVLRVLLIAQRETREQREQDQSSPRGQRRQRHQSPERAERAESAEAESGSQSQREAERRAALSSLPLVSALAGRAPGTVGTGDCGG